MSITTRRFFARPCGVSLAATGSASPRPVTEIIEADLRLLGKLADDNGLTGLSMGMSDDFETAVMLGASHLRVGSALFGDRG